MTPKTTVLFGVLLWILASIISLVALAVHGTSLTDSLDVVSSFGFSSSGIPFDPQFVPLLQGLLIASVGGFLLMVAGLLWAVLSGVARITIMLFSRFVER